MTHDELREVAGILEDVSRRASENRKHAIEVGYPDESLIGSERDQIYMASLFAEQATRAEELRRKCCALASQLSQEPVAWAAIDVDAKCPNRKDVESIHYSRAVADQLVEDFKKDGRFLRVVPLIVGGSHEDTKENGDG